MSGYPTAVILACLGFLWTVSGQEVASEFQFENLSIRNTEQMWRSSAAALKTLRFDLQGRKQFSLDLCPQRANPLLPIIAYIENIRYSNDGPSDEVSISLGEVFIGSFDTHSIYNWGRQWNFFDDTGVVGRRFPLNNNRGKETLRFRVRTDKYGVELDTVSIKATNQKPGVELICQNQNTRE